MAWGVKNVENERKSFCLAILTEKKSISAACRHFDVSRPTGYLWLKRYKEKGISGLTNLSSARLNQPHKTTEEKETLIILLKAEFPQFGAKKILPKLIERFPEEDWPCTTTIHNILIKNGLVQSRKLRRRLSEITTPLHQSQAPNDIWCMDFKGWFMTKDKHKFDPFTLTDHESRYLLRCNKLNINDTDSVWAILDVAFREYGLPIFLRSDNGPPFATTCPGRLSKLAVKLLKAGVNPEWIEPGKPQQNGRHERMHLTMEKEGFELGSSMKEQLIRIKEFQEYYNFERPHEALDQKTPGSVYKPSSRVWNGIFNEIEYPKEYRTAKVKKCGRTSWKGKDIYVSQALSGERVGMIEGEEGVKMYFGNIFLGTINGDQLECERLKGRKRKYPDCR